MRLKSKRKKQRINRKKLSEKEIFLFIVYVCCTPSLFRAILCFRGARICVPFNYNLWLRTRRVRFGLAHFGTWSRRFHLAVLFFSTCVGANTRYKLWNRKTFNYFCTSSNILIRSITATYWAIIASLVLLTSVIIAVNDSPILTIMAKKQK
jgi:hypothetical protein